MQWLPSFAFASVRSGVMCATCDKRLLTRDIRRFGVDIFFQRPVPWVFVDFFCGGCKIIMRRLVCKLSESDPAEFINMVLDSSEIELRLLMEPSVRLDQSTPISDRELDAFKTELNTCNFRVGSDGLSKFLEALK